MSTKITVASTAEFKATDPLTASDELRTWLRDIPDGAEITPITRDIGDQRDPWHILVGLRAKWQEVR